MAACVPVPMAAASRTAAALLLVTFVAACSSSDDDGAGTDDENGTEVDGVQQYPDIVDVTVEGGGGIYDFSVTISSPYDTPDRYADGWRVMDDGGTVYGEHQLMHDHAGEQPFTRTQTDVQIPEGVTEVIVEGRDLANGYGGETATVALPGR